MTTRYREQGQNNRVPLSGRFDVVDGWIDTKSTGQYGVLNNGVLDYLDYSKESMTDVGDNPGGINQCNHEKWFCGGDPAVAHIEYTDSRAGYNGRMKIDIEDGAGDALLQYSKHIPVPDGSAIALSRLPTLAPAQLSILNSVYELKDCKHALERVVEHIAWARLRAVSRSGRKKTAFSNVNDTKEGFLKDLLQIPQTPYQWITRMTGWDLAWKFGWKPLLEDIQTVHSTLGSLNKSFRELSEKEFTVVGSHHEEKSDTPAHYNKYRHSYLPYLWLTHRVSRTTRGAWYYGAKRKLSPQAISTPDMTKLAIAREKLGLSLNASVVWEAVPFSFVVDWLLPINNFLDQFNGSPIDPSYVETTAKWTTTKMVTTTEVEIMLDPFDGTYKPHMVVDTGNTTIQNSRVSSTKVNYTRTSGSWTPPGLYLPQLKLPNIGQTWTGIELLLQRFRTIAK